MIEIIFKLIICHLVGDYVLQNDYIANNKSKNYYILFVHCFLYLLLFYMFFGFTWHLIIVFVFHIITDYLKSTKKINYWQDQTIHFLTMIIYFI